MEGEGGRGAEHLAVSWRGGKGDSCCRDGTAPSFRYCTARTKLLGSTLNQLVRRAGANLCSELRSSRTKVH